jgi:SAM-dependent methyltransferase
MIERSTAHSEQYFSTYRDYWWNRDFLDLIAARLDLGRYNSLLDVGCGQCHWSKLLVNYLARPTTVTGLDSDRKWAKSSERMAQYFEEFGASLSLVHGDAQALPFEDASFDMVTCQTLLIHLQEPDLAIQEMKRVLKPGGLVLCAEPNNLVQTLTKSSLSDRDTIEETLEHIKYALICEEGKKQLGQGDNSIGDLVPGLLARHGFEHIDVCLSDKAIPLYPPYTNSEQKATLHEWEKGQSCHPEGRSDLEYFEALGDAYISFYEKYHEKYALTSRRMQEWISRENYHAAGGAILYLISAQKP